MQQTTEEGQYGALLCRRMALSVATGSKEKQSGEGTPEIPADWLCLFCEYFLLSLSAVGFSNRNALLIAQKLEFELNFTIICSEARLLG